MNSCLACSSPLRQGARFCTRCGAPVVEAAPPVVEAAAPIAEAAPPGASLAVPSRIPPTAASSMPPRSAAAVGALIAGIAPLAISIVGNLVAAELARAALSGAEGGAAEGAWAPVLFVLALVFVLTAGALTVCGILGARALRETSAGRARGHGLAIAGLAVGGVNLVLWVAGIIVTVGSLGSLIA